MPVLPTYPGIFIEENRSGVRAITGVATAITAFLGRAVRGPVDEPVAINSWGDFEGAFGGLHIDFPASYSVRDFYQNGGQQAIMVRLYKAPEAPADSTALLKLDGLTLTAKSPGAWGKKLRATIDVEISEENRARLGLSADDALFNLTIRLGNTVERHPNLTVKNNSGRADRVLKKRSSLVKIDPWPDDAVATTKVVAAQTAYLALQKALQGVNQTEINTAKQNYHSAKADLDDPATKAEKALAAAVEAKNAIGIAAAKTAIQNAETAMKGSDGDSGGLDDAAYLGSQDLKSGLYALEKADLFNLLCIPPDSRDSDTPAAVYQAAMAYCWKRRAMLIVDSPTSWSRNRDTAAAAARDGIAALGLSGEYARNAAIFFPRVLQSDPLGDGLTDTFVPCGIVAGVIARTDTSRGIWKAPAGLDAALNGIVGLNVTLHDAENGMLNALGINCLREFPAGRVVWGARTLRGADHFGDEYKYIPVRRLALFIEESLYRGSQWVVFEQNDEPLWGQIRLNVGFFMHNLFRQGAFQGSSPREAYFVKCDKETTTQNDINLGIVNVVVGFAPLKPAEFVIIKLQLIAGKLEV